MGKILPILLALIGLGAGIGAGIALRPAPLVEVTVAEADCETDCAEVAGTAEGSDTPDEVPDSEFIKMNNQFVVPIVSDDKVTALVVMSLSLELETGSAQIFYQREPKLRDAFLQVLFDHANSGGFDGVFTKGRKMDSLRMALLEMARKVMGNPVRDVLITDILRQDS